MAVYRVGQEIYFTARRVGNAGSLRLRYHPNRDARPRKGTLEHFLTERYCLYTVARGRIHRAEIHHPPQGARRVRAELRLAHAIRVGRKRVERLMRQAGLSGLVRRKRGRRMIRACASPMTWSSAVPARGAERALGR